MNNIRTISYAQQLSFQLLLILLIGIFISVGHGVLVPIYFSILLSILLLPVTNLLQKCYLPATMANLVAVILALAVIATIVYFISAQMIGFLNDVPAIREHLAGHITSLQKWLEQKVHISTEVQKSYIDDIREGVRHSGGQYIGQTFLTVSQTVMFTIIVAIYSFLILCYRQLIRRFLFAVFSSQHKERLQFVLLQSKQIIQKYMTGLLIEMAIVAACNSAVLLIIGVKYAVFLGVFAAVLNIVPYIGLFTSLVFTVLVTLGNSSSMNEIIWIIVGMETIHFLDANFLMTKIVGSKVKINALMTIVGVVIGGSMIGLPGIFLALPTIAIVNVIFSQIDALKPWSILLSDDNENIPEKRILRHLKKLSDKRKAAVVLTQANKSNATDH
ncbi:AI-2E family transporter [Ferruginibacter paludis]|uniref:AI-2E family transporter n=1 Tax=Ferruginibacter paludis TaxID=1310417 RepID=UPI0025B5B186|nr:AI-2E family transporter [Ferruginibacter paludis]MDN3658066.1 AI-2E family transporter [Ferruginibacter paludis]